MVTGSRPGAQLVAVGVQGPGSTAAVRYAAWLAAERGWDLMLVHAYARPGTSRADRPDAEAHHEAEAVLDRVVTDLGPDVGARVHRVVREGSVVTTLLDVSRYVTRLVVGAGRAEGRGAVTWTALGLGVAVAARCPVVVVPATAGSGTTAQGPVVVAVDPSTPTVAAAALDRACEEVASDGRPLVVLHVLALDADQADVRRASEQLETLVASAVADRSGVEARAVVVQGALVPTLAQRSRSASLVVVSRPRRTRHRDAWAHSVARQLVSVSACPVLVAP